MKTAAAEHCHEAINQHCASIPKKSTIDWLLK